ncbi:MAG: ankyrin repeat domain-containing protein [Akkermansia sp.]|nr:ankyrin repeat domain-containing protein [Akkermansia sp.]
MGYDENSYGVLLVESVLKNNIERVRALIALNTDVNSLAFGGYSALSAAVQLGHTDIVRFLVTVENIDLDYVDCAGRSALRWAEEKELSECAEILRQAGAHSIQRAPKNTNRRAQEEATARLQVMGIWPNSYNSAICNATDKGDNSVLRDLITAGADVNAVAEDGCTPLTNVCIYGNTDGLFLLLNAPGIEVNRKNENGDTALICAATNGKLNCLSLLLSAPGIDTSLVDNEGKTATERARENEHRACLVLLKAVGMISPDIRLGYDANTAQNILNALGIPREGYNQLVGICAELKDNVILRLLLAAGANANTVMNNGWTPLTFSCQLGNTEGVRLLLAAPGIEVNKPNNDCQTPLLIATRKGNTEILRLLNEAGAKVTQPTLNNNDRAAQEQLRAMGITPDKYNQAICNATDTNNNTLLRLLINAGADVNAFGSDGWTPLTNCCVKGNEQGVRLLLAAPGIDVNLQNKIGTTPVITAAIKGNITCLRLLLNAPGIDINRGCADGTTSYNIAHENRQFKCAKLLEAVALISPDNRLGYDANTAQEILSALSVPTEAYNQFICFISSENDNVLLRLLIAAGADVNATGADGWTPLTNCCLLGNTEGVRLLLAAPGIDVNKPNNNGQTPLQIASDNGYTEIVRLLNRDDANATPDSTPAPANGDKAAQEQLREQGITPDKYNQAICNATDTNNNTLLRLLIAAGADVNATGDDGWTPLANCCYYHNVEGVRLLLAAPGIDINKAINDGTTPLQIAESKGYTEIVRMLNEFSVNILDGTPAPANGDKAAQEQLKEMGIYPFSYRHLLCMAALHKGNERQLSLLIAAGADVNCVLGGWTPLTLSSAAGNVEGVRLLLAAPGIEVNKPNNDGQTPLQLATREGYTEIVRMLNEAGATAAE